MTLKSMTLKNFFEKIRSGEISAEEHALKILDEAQKLNGRYHYFNIFNVGGMLRQARELDKKGTDELLIPGLPISVKDCIVVRGVESTAGSAILKGYIPPFNAHCVNKATANGGLVLGKTSQDEFGFGGFSTNTGVGYEVPRNPFDIERSCGGSSGGAAGFTAKTSFPHAAIAESTGGSIVCPASFCGVAGISPTYGLVSRHGLIDYANSMDKIGSMGKTVYDAALMLQSISGHDHKDAASSHSKEDYLSYINKDSKLRVGIISNAFGSGVSEGVKEVVQKALSNMDVGELSETALPFTFEYGISAYYILAMAEASTNLARYCGMRYGAEEPLQGNFNEYFSNVRTKYFGAEAKRRILLGTFVRMAGYRDAYYLRAAKLRTKIISEYKQAFKKYDVLISPTMPITAPKIDEIKDLSPLQQYMMDILTIGPNIAGLPHMNVNAGMHDGLPVGMMLIGDHFQEGKIIQLGEKVHKEAKL